MIARGKKLLGAAKSMMNRTNTGTIKNMMKSGSIFKRTTKGDRLAYTSIRNQAIPTGYKNSFQNRMDVGLDFVGGGISKGAKRLASNFVSSPVALTTQFAVGSAAMATVASMQGGFQKMNQVMSERYMRDSRYSSQMLAQTNIGRASGNSSLSIGNHTGLSLSMHKGRHG